jgi:hypothetical protein
MTMPSESTLIVPSDLQAGDLLLVKTPGVIYKLGRFLMGTPYDHISVVVCEKNTANVVWPQNTYCSIDRLLTPSRQPVAIRPKWKTEAEKAQFLAWMHSLMGQRYNYLWVWAHFLRMLMRKHFGIAYPMRKLDVRQELSVCTEAVLHGLTLQMSEFDPSQHKQSDWQVLQCASTNDYLALPDVMPELFHLVGSQKPKAS